MTDINKVADSQDSNQPTASKEVINSADNADTDTKKVTDPKKHVRVLFICRVILWIISLAATVYWIVWSFKIYKDLGDPNTGLVDETVYSPILRPKLYAGLIITVVSLTISSALRKISDLAKKDYDDWLRGQIYE